MRKKRIVLQIPVAYNVITSCVVTLSAISPEMVMDGWMRSDGHRANILNASYTKISVSCYYDGSTYYWVQNFAY